MLVLSRSKEHDIPSEALEGVDIAPLSVPPLPMSTVPDTLQTLTRTPPQIILALKYEQKPQMHS